MTVIPTVVAHGVDEAFHLIGGVAGRMRDTHGAWNAAKQPVFAMQRRWWLTGGGGTWGAPSEATLKRDARGNRDPRMMRDTGELAAAATIEGAPGQILETGASYLFFGIAAPHEALYQAERGRWALADPSWHDADAIGEAFMDYFLTGRQ